MIRGIHHVAINTANFKEMIDFYRRAFGFEPIGEVFSWADSPFVDSVVGVSGSAARTVMLKADNAYLELFEYSAPPARDADPLRPHDRGYTHFCVDTDDIEADFKKLTEAGMTFGRALPDGAGGIRAIYGKDPDGNIIELQQLAPTMDFTLQRLRGNSLREPPPAPIAWERVLKDLEGVGSILNGVSRADDDALRAQAVLHGLMLIGQGYTLNMAADEDRPRWVPNFHWPNSSLGNCPDTTYYYTPLNARGAYRIWGRRNNIHMVDFQIGEAFYGSETGGTNKALSNFDLDDRAQTGEGKFDFVLSAVRPPNWSGDWLELPSAAKCITVRQVAYDWEAEQEAELHIERLDPPASTERDSNYWASKVRAIAAYACRLAEFSYGARLSSDVRARGLINGNVDILDFGEAGGLANQFYCIGAFNLEPDQALIVDIDVPKPCRYWGIQLSDEMNAALDYIFRQSSLNGSQAAPDRDGRYRFVIAHRDPGVPNWLDTGGTRSGLFMGRWREPASKPRAPGVTPVRIDQVVANLPADTARVSPAERQKRLIGRQRSMLNRLRY